MIKIEVDGPNVTLGASGTVKRQICEFAAAFHAWAYQMSDDPAIVDALRDVFVGTITDEKTWRINPSRVEKVYEVDEPEELFGPGGD